MPDPAPGKDDASGKDQAPATGKDKTPASGGNAAQDKSSVEEEYSLLKKVIHDILKEGK